MRNRFLLPTLIAVLLAACAPRTAGTLPPTPLPFPTMTPGIRVIGSLSTPVPQENTLANPATAIALASQPTATPNYSACPEVTGAVTFPVVVERGLTLMSGLPVFLNQGGELDVLRTGLEAAGLLGETGTINNTHDFTGEATPEVLITFVDPEIGGMAVILNCENGRYITRYQANVGDTAPQLVRVADMNADDILDAVVSAQVCSDVDGLCQYRTNVITWDPTRGQFLNLLSTPPDGDTLPSIGDIDNDRVLEIITVQSENGTAETGPIRTGSQIYDWNGANYVLSVAQPDPLRFVIQIVHEADRAFREDRTDDAVRLYAAALDDEDLAYWIGADERVLLPSYIRYRLLLTFTFAENGDPLTIYEDIRNTNPNFEEAPVYAVMADAFWNAYQESNNLNTGCVAALTVAEERPLALESLNRYGTRSPTYTLDQLCPF
ncbi:MAG: hypothetical protein AAF125_00355 [Chloroflexota bacterium]